MDYTPNEYQVMIEGGCPHCGEALLIKQGKHGEFLACSEWCGYTKSIPSRSEYPPQTKITVCPHNKCDGSRLIPFKKDGRIIPNAWVDCSCHPIYGLNPEPERYHTARPEDYDYPMSYDQWRAICQYHGWPDPGTDRPIEQPERTPVKEITRMVLPKVRLDLLESQIAGLKKGYHTHQKSQRKSKYD